MSCNRSSYFGSASRHGSASAERSAAPKTQQTITSLPRRVRRVAASRIAGSGSSAPLEIQFARLSRLPASQLVRALENHVVHVDGYGAVLLCVQHRRVDAAVMLIEANPRLIDYEDSEKSNVLHYFAKHVTSQGAWPDTWVIRQWELLKPYIDTDLQAQSSNVHGLFPLDVAVQADNAIFAELLLQTGVGIQLLSSRSASWFPLHHCVRHGLVAMLKILVRYGADVNQFDRFGQTPLSIAARTHRCVPHYYCLDHYCT